MVWVRELVALAVIATTACDAYVPPPLPHDPAGPCLQLPWRHVRRVDRGTLWRGDTVVESYVAPNLDRAVEKATADNAAAAAEARLYYRMDVASLAVGISAPVWLDAGAAASYRAYREGNHYAAAGLMAGGVALFLSAIAANILLNHAGEEDRQKALDIYNANPPPRCPPARDTAGRESS